MPSATGKLSIALAVVLLVAAIGVLDSVTGTEIRVFPLYFVPLSLAAWHFGRAAAATACLACTAAWTLSYLFSGTRFQHPATIYFNTLALLVAFATVTALIVLLRERVLREHELSRTDSLTGLRNRRAFQELAEQEIERARRYGSPLTVAFLDVDDFKLLNDRQGHLAGDQLLVGVGRLLQAGVRRSDVAARMGGDEFALLLPETDHEAGRRALANLHERLNALASEHEAPVGFSVGAVCFRSVPAEVSAALSRADSVMYEVKRGSRNGLRIELYD